MSKFTVTLYEIAAHSFTVDALNKEAAIRAARAKFDAQVDSDTCISLGLDLDRSPAVAFDSLPPAKKARQSIDRAAALIPRGYAGTRN